MFAVGDYIFYGNQGVCQVEGTLMMSKPGQSEERMYYQLSPIEKRGSSVFTPIDNDKVVMRPILTEEEAWALIREIPEIEQIDLGEERRREDVLKEVMRTCEPRSFIAVIKTLNPRKQERLTMGKKATVLDMKYLKAAETYLYGEISAAIGKEKDETELLLAEYLS